MKNPFKKEKVVKTYTTKYVVYFNKPKEGWEANSYIMSGTWQATEFDSLHKARDFAQSQAKYFQCYVGEVTPLFKYTNETVEEAL